MARVYVVAGPVERHVEAAVLVGEEAIAPVRGDVLHDLGVREPAAAQRVAEQVVDVRRVEGRERGGDVGERVPHLGRVLVEDPQRPRAVVVERGVEVEDDHRRPRPLAGRAGDAIEDGSEDGDLMGQRRGLHGRDDSRRNARGAIAERHRNRVRRVLQARRRGPSPGTSENRP